MRAFRICTTPYIEFRVIHVSGVLKKSSILAYFDEKRSTIGQIWPTMVIFDLFLNAPTDVENFEFGIWCGTYSESSHRDLSFQLVIIKMFPI